MDRPLWQIFLAILLLFFVVHRGAIAVVAHLSDWSPALLAGYGLQAVVGLATAVGMWRGAKWVVGSLALLGVSVAGTALFAGFYLGTQLAARAVSEALVAAVSTGALAVLLRYELSDRDGSGTGESRREGPSGEERRAQGRGDGVPSHSEGRA